MLGHGTHPPRCDTFKEDCSRASMSSPPLWLPLADVQAATLDPGRRQGRLAGALLRTRRKVARLVGEADADLLAYRRRRSRPAGQPGATARAGASGAWRIVARGVRPPVRPSWAARVRGFAAPPRRRPGAIDGQLDGLRGAPSDVTALLDRRSAPRPTPPGPDLAHQHPRDAASVRKQVAAVGRAFREREAARSEVVRVFWPLRTFYLRAATLLNLGIPAVAAPVMPRSESVPARSLARGRQRRFSRAALAVGESTARHSRLTRHVLPPTRLPAR